SDLSPKRRQAQSAIRAAHDPSALADALEHFGLARMPSYWPLLDRIEMPLTIVVGERDAKFRMIGGEIAQRVRHARVEIVTGAGHNVVLEAPERVAEIVSA